ncbi:MAG: chorismate mutase [Clostridia bacterium]|nr:chorismate mutase [Clostridia bacterium]
MKNKLTLAREKINEIDREMARLFVERMKASELVAEYKKEHGLEILDPIREAEVIRRNSEAVENDVYREYYVNFQKNTMSLSRAYQSRLLTGMKVAYSGTEGAYAHLAALKLFPTASAHGYGSFDEAYSAVEKGECDVAVLPIENSYNGDVGQVSDLMFSGPLYVNTVTELAISHDLLAPKGTKLEDVRTVFSHPQALGQCHKYIVEHKFDEIEFANTALAAKHVAARNDGKSAAIASAEAAELFGLEVLATNINESRSNTTRFAVFSRSENKNSITDKRVHTILLFTVRHEAGALAKALDVIAKYGFNMGALRSRPMKELLWQYYFYVEAEGNLDSEDGRRMMTELKEYCDRLKTVGSYTVL